MSNKNEIFGVSLNELAFLLFFLIVLLSAVKINNDKEIIDNKTEQSAFLEQKLKLTQKELDHAVSELNLVKDKLSEIFSSGKQLNPDYLDEQITNLVRLEEKNRNLETELQKTKEQLEKEQESSALLEKINTTLTDSGVDDAQALIDAYKKEVVKNKTLMGQYKNIERRLVGNGLDHPPCWADSESGRPEYMFNIKIMAETYILERSWPAYRNDEMQEIAFAIDEDLPSEFTHQEFRKLANPILLHSKEQEPECRHFVMVKDSTETSKEQYKNGLSRVENYFYKLIVR